MKIIGLLFPPLPACPEHPHCSCGPSLERCGLVVPATQVGGWGCGGEWKAFCVFACGTACTRASKPRVRCTELSLVPEPPQVLCICAKTLFMGRDHSCCLCARTPKPANPILSSLSDPH